MQNTNSNIGLRIILYLTLCLSSSLPINAQENILMDIQGHRGCRGLFPENTIPAFEHALELGVSTLELDVVISKDKKVIVSHEAFMSHLISRTPEGNAIEETHEKDFNLYELTYEEIKEFDCGSSLHPKYPEQKNLSVHKPSLGDMVKRMEEISNSHMYNIEIKRTPEGDNIYHPDYREFADLLIRELNQLNISDRTTVQCFDVETLQYLKKSYPDVPLVYLIANENSFEENIEILGFDPYCYSPHFSLVNQDLVSNCKSKKIQLIPWTVNDKNDMIQLIKLGVDGIISDYPDILIDSVNHVGLK